MSSQNGTSLCRIPLSAQNACEIFQFARTSGPLSLKNKALDFILKAPCAVFEDLENFKILSAQSFMEILTKDELAVKNEMKLFHWVLSWGRAQCEGLKPRDYEDHFRNILSQVLPGIRFTRMGIQEFMDQVYPTNLLEDALLAKILPKLHNPHLPKENARKYWDPFSNLPAEMIREIFLHVEMPDLLRCRLLSKRMREIIEEKFPLEINLTESKLLQIGYLSKFHAFSTIKFRAQKFTDLIKIQLISFISASLYQSKLQLHVTLEVVPDLKVLFSFLSETSKINLKLYLNIINIHHYDDYLQSFESGAKFPQLIFLCVESLQHENQVEGLIEIVRNSPNLREISMGSFLLRPILSVNSQTTKFLTSVKLTDVILSIANLDLKNQLNLNFFLQLYRQNVFIKKVYFNDDWRDENIDFVDLFHLNLVEVYGVHMHESTPCLKRALPNLKILCVGCSPHYLCRVLEKAPNLEKLMWSHFPWENISRNPTNPFSLGTLEKLTQLNVKIYRQEDLEGLELLCKICPNVKNLKLWIGCPCSILTVYKFLKLEQLSLIQEGGLTTENFTGVREDQLDDKFLMKIYNERPPFIGSLKKLTTLNFGLLDYQNEAWSWRWKIKKMALQHGIIHAHNLKSIIFPPMKMTLAQKILTFMAINMKQIDQVQIQTWGQNGPIGVVTQKDVEEMAGKFSPFFKITAIQVMEQDGVRHPIFK